MPLNSVGLLFIVSTLLSTDTLMMPCDLQFRSHLHVGIRLHNQMQEVYFILLQQCSFKLVIDVPHQFQRKKIIVSVVGQPVHVILVMIFINFWGQQILLMLFKNKIYIVNSASGSTFTNNDILLRTLRWFIKNCKKL